MTTMRKIAHENSSFIKSKNIISIELSTIRRVRTDGLEPTFTSNFPESD